MVGVNNGGDCMSWPTYPDDMHPDYDQPTPTGLLGELADLIERLVADAPPERHQNIRAAGDRLVSACVGDRAKAASEGRTNRSIKLDIEIMTILMEISDARAIKGLDRVNHHSHGAAGEVYDVMMPRWREAHKRWREAGKVGRKLKEPKEPKFSTIEHRILILKKEFPLTIVPDDNPTT
jgi:hypothetical protein